MKTPVILSVILLLFNGVRVLAQCIADAGPDQIVCLGLDDPQQLQIGPENGPLQGYTYAWETIHEGGFGEWTYTFTASDFLTDTTLLHPTTMGDGIDGPLEFILHATDSQGNTCTDTMQLRWTRYGTHLGYMVMDLTLGDSIYLSGFHNVGGGIPPLQYLWRPNHGLTDSTSVDFWAKPEVTTYYYITVTDSAGCVGVGAPVYHVNVHPVSVEESAISDIEVMAYPNPAGDMLQVSWSSDHHPSLDLRISDMSGRTVAHHSQLHARQMVDISALHDGIYLYMLIGSDGVVGQGRIVVQ